VTKKFQDPITKLPRTYWGKLHFNGHEARPKYFTIFWEDGEVWYNQINRTPKQLQLAEMTLHPEGTSIPVSIPTPVSELNNSASPLNVAGTSLAGM